MGKQIKGILGTKLGMTQVFNEAGQIVPVTVVQAGPCVVTAVRTPDRDGYSAVQFGYGEIDPRKVNKPVSGVFAKAGLTPRRYLAELRPQLVQQFKYTSPMQAPRIEKITLNMGVGEAKQDKTRARLAEQATIWVKPLVALAGGIINGGREADVDTIMMGR